MQIMCSQRNSHHMMMNPSTYRAKDITAPSGRALTDVHALCQNPLYSRGGGAISYF
jgi:hypothetical protein